MVVRTWLHDDCSLHTKAFCGWRKTSSDTGSTTGIASELPMTTGYLSRINSCEMFGTFRRMDMRANLGIRLPSRFRSSKGFWMSREGRRLVARSIFRQRNQCCRSVKMGDAFSFDRKGAGIRADDTRSRRQRSAKAMIMHDWSAFMVNLPTLPLHESCRKARRNEQP
jgi:hypothetical protein